MLYSLYYTSPQFLSCKSAAKMENSVNPDQSPADLDLQCFEKKIHLNSAGQWLTSSFKINMIFSDDTEN